MDYILELGMCQSPVTVSADLPAVAQGVVRGVRRRGEAGNIPAPPELPPSLRARYRLPQASPQSESLDSSEALSFCCSLQPSHPFTWHSAVRSPAAPFPKGLRPSLSACRPLLALLRDSAHTHPLPRPLPASSQGAYPIPLSARPLPPSRHPSPGRPGVAPLDGDPGRGWRGPPTAVPSPGRPRAPEPPGPPPAPTALTALGERGVPARSRSRTAAAAAAASGNGGRGRGLAAGGGACPGMARPRGGAGGAGQQPEARGEGVRSARGGGPGP